MARTPSFYRRYGLWIIAAATVIVPFAIYGAHKGFESNHNRVEDWLPKTFEETSKLQWFVDRFGGDEILCASWEGCTLADPRALAVREALLKPIPLGDGREAALFRAVYTGPQLLAELTDAPLNLSREEALDRMQGWLVGPDGNSTSVVALVSDAGDDDRTRSVDFVYDVCQRVAGLSQEEVRLAGSTVDGVAIDRASAEALLPFNIVCWLTCFALAWRSLRHWWVAGLVFWVSLVSQWSAVAAIYYHGTQLDAVLLIVATLGLVLAVSASLHLVNYYRDAVREFGIEGAADRAVAHALAPTLVANGTTALGVVSLQVSSMVPIYNFGFYSAVATILGMTWVLVLLPSLLEYFPPRGWARETLHAEHRGSADTGGIWRPWAMWTTRHHRPIIAVAFTLLAVAGYGLSRLSTTVNLHGMFRDSAQVIRDYDWIQARIGPMVPMEIVLRFPCPDGTRGRVLPRLQFVERVRAEVAAVEHVGATLSAATFSPELPAGGGASGTVERAAFESRVSRRREELRELQYVYDEPHEELWRISVRVEAQRSLDYGDFLSQLGNVVAPLVVEAKQEEFAGLEAVLCGGIPLINQAQHQLLSDLFSSFVTAFFMVAAALVVLFRSLTAGLLAMFPNTLPSLLVFGALGFLDVKIEIGSMLTASLAMGIAVDDTVHFITWFRRAIADGCTRQQAVLSAFERCGAATVQTAFVLTFGMLVYSLSPFVPTARFAWLMFVLLYVALVCDLFMTPAILASPLGRFFEKVHLNESLLGESPTAPASTPNAAPAGSAK